MDDVRAVTDKFDAATGFLHAPVPAKRAEAKVDPAPAHAAASSAAPSGRAKRRRKA